jgi:hypothetical protein
MLSLDGSALSGADLVCCIDVVAQTELPRRLARSIGSIF